MILIILLILNVATYYFAKKRFQEDLRKDLEIYMLLVEKGKIEPTEVLDRLYNEITK